jgi:predicted RNA methylase
MEALKMGNALAEENVPTLQKMFGEVYNAFEGSETMADYTERHNVNAAAVLTVIDDETAHLITERIADRIAGKTVVEIGGGIGLLSLHMGQIAKRVYCIEANPMWSWTFATVLLKQKPKNVSFLFGSADEFLGVVKADVAVYCTHSDVHGMGLVAAQFAPVVIDFYSELIAENPSAFDQTAVALRNGVMPYGQFEAENR